jgi:hypothetical protein
MSDPKATDEPVPEDPGAEPATESVPSTSVPDDQPPVPSPTAVEGWTRGVDGNWWPPVPTRRRPLPTPPPQKYRRRIGRRLTSAFGMTIFVLAVVAMVGAIIVVIRDFEDTKPATPTVTSPAHAVGETARTASIDVTLTGVHDPYLEPTPTAQARPGYHYVSADVTITNTGDKDFVMSAEQLVTLVDAAGQRQEQTFVTSVASIEGAIAAHDARGGSVVFNVANGAGTPLTLRVKGEESAGGVTFVIS